MKMRKTLTACLVNVLPWINGKQVQLSIVISIVRNNASTRCDSRLLDRRWAGKVIKHFVDDPRVSDIGNNTQPAACVSVTRHWTDGNGGLELGDIWSTSYRLEQKRGILHSISRCLSSQPNFPCNLCSLCQPAMPRLLTKQTLTCDIPILGKISTFARILLSYRHTSRNH
jgi:hypothetical protein